MATFALVHGAWHGAWCWERLKPELESRAHRVVAMDLPSEDPEATFSDYADIVISELEGRDDEIVLVGHSLAGNTIPLVAARRPVRRLVYVCGMIAAPGKSFDDQFAEADEPILQPGYRAGVEADDRDRSRWVDFELAWSELYADCDEASARSAFDRLRPQSSSAYTVACPLEALPAVETVYVRTTEDRMLTPEWTRTAPVERLGVEPVGLPGSHSPMLSRPRELADLLVRGL